MRKGDTYKSKLDGKKWTIQMVDKAKQIVFATCGKFKGKFNRKRFINTMEVQNV